MIRAATVRDIPAILEMGRQFHAMGQPGRFDHAATAAFLGGLIRDGVVFVAPFGMIGGRIIPAFYDPGYSIAVELFWWCESGAGGELRQAFEEWARSEGADEVRMSSIEWVRGPAVCRALRGAGYHVAETSMRKVL